MSGLKSILLGVVFVLGFHQISGQTVAELERGLAQAKSPELQWDLHYKLARNYLVDKVEVAALHADTCLQLAKTLGSNQKLAQSSQILGDIYTRLHETEKAVLVFTQAQKAAAASGETDIELSAVENLEAIALQKEEFKLAYQWKNERLRILQALARANSDQKNNRIKALEKNLSDQKSNQINLILLGLAGFALVFLIMYQQLRRAGKRVAGELAEKNALIEEKRRRSEQLLLNILPRAVAAELTVRNKVAARRYESTTVMFIDFVGFTLISEQLSPEALVEALDQCFSKFDTIIGRYRIEKIKTVGDAYICASGLSDRNEHPAEMIKAAIEMQAFLKQFELPVQGDSIRFNARIGIHFGPVVAGVVGTKKFAYDIWGDTVNTAARMEEASSPGRINVSGTVQAICADAFSWEYRGKIATKNKSELEMYYLSAEVGA